MTTRGARAIPVAVAAIIIFIAFYKGHRKPSRDPVAFVHDEPGIRIMVSGNVNKPGIYTVSLPNEANIVNALTVAGVRADCDLSSIDFSAVCDGTAIRVNSTVHGNQVVTRSSLRLRERIYLSMPVDLNQLSVQEWEWLPGIGPRLAEALVADRQQNGGFGRFEDLERVPGVGETRVKQIKNFILRKN